MRASRPRRVPRDTSAVLVFGIRVPQRDAGRRWRRGGVLRWSTALPARTRPRARPTVSSTRYVPVPDRKTASNALPTEGSNPESSSRASRFRSSRRRRRRRPSGAAVRPVLPCPVKARPDAPLASDEAACASDSSRQRQPRARGGRRRRIGDLLPRRPRNGFRARARAPARGPTRSESANARLVYRADAERSRSGPARPAATTTSRDAGRTKNAPASRISSRAAARGRGRGEILTDEERPSCAGATRYAPGSRVDDNDRRHDRTRCARTRVGNANPPVDAAIVSQSAGGARDGAEIANPPDPSEFVS